VEDLFYLMSSEGIDNCHLMAINRETGVTLHLNVFLGTKKMPLVEDEG
jgi:hypothetical protein